SLDRAPLIDHRYDVRLSAGKRDPVYRIEGTAGFVAQFRSVTDVRTDLMLRALYVPAFHAKAEPEAKPEPEAKAEPPVREPLPLDPSLALALERDRKRAAGPQA